MTNRDKFNAMNNATLAEILCRKKDYSICDFCSYIDDLMSNYSCHQSCFEGVKTWLDAPCKENSPADNPQEAIPTEVRVDLRKVAKEIVGECKKHYPNGCEDCRYGDSIGLCCFKDRPITWGVEIADKGQPDNVNHPSHYTSGKIEVIDFIEDKQLGFHLGNAIKYISRAGRKNPDKTIEDLRKAAWYLNRQIERLERVEND